MDVADIVYRPARELVAAIASGEIAPSALLDAFLARIAACNPDVNAIVSLDEAGARAQAAVLDREQAAGRVGVLHGLPIAVKDLAATRGLRTTFGSPIHADWVPDYDELFVARLRAAGANIIGKTNTPEFGAGSQTFNPVFGITRNPYDRALTCGGSSGGAAVALACGMLPLADGSDLGGSLRNPAAFCNVVGFRPSPGRVPSWPKLFSSDPLAVNGPMARDVADVALFLSVMAGPDPRVPISLLESGASFRRPLARDWHGTRIAWSPDLGRHAVEPAVLEVLERALPVFESLGCHVEPACPDLTDADAIFRTLRAWMFLVRGRDDYARHRDRMKDTLIWNIEEGLKLTADDVARAEIARSALVGRCADFFQRYDFLLCPATQVMPFPVEQDWVREIAGTPLRTYLDWMGVCCDITVTGLPAIAVPAGFSATGLPVGLQIVGRRWGDFELLQFAHAFEAATGHGLRRPEVGAARTMAPVVAGGSAQGSGAAQAAPARVHSDVEPDAARRLCAGVSHAFGNALMPVTLYGDLLERRDREALDARTREYLEVIEQAVDHVQNTIARLRAYYQTEYTATDPQAVPVNDLVTAARDVLPDVPAADPIALDLAPDAPWVNVVAADLRDALVELLSNAREAAGAHGAIHVATARHTTPAGVVLCHVSITDDGPGMDDATVARCREPFFSTRSGATRGLGLAIAEGAVLRAGGRLAIDSHPGGGTRITLVLPTPPT